MIFEKTLDLLKTYGLTKFLYYSFLELCIFLYRRPLLKSYSQCYEDLIIAKYFKNKKEGFYVDIGAYDPVRFSNTKKFYDLGWCGINVEPNVTRFNLFVIKRPNDINLNIGISSKETLLNFYLFNPGTLNTFSKSEYMDYVKEGYKHIETKKVRVFPLRAVLSKYAYNKKIDFLSVDTEGLDYDVLRSNDWIKFKPKLICIESRPHLSSSGVEGSTKYDLVENLLQSKGYKVLVNNGLNTIYEYID